MYSAARKLHLIKDLIQLKDETALLEIESLLKKTAQNHGAGRPSAHEFVGLWSKEDTDAIENAVDDGCE